MKLLFVHGWSVTDMATYGELPLVLHKEAARQGLKIELVDIYLGRYVSFDDTITMRDVTRAFHHAIAEQVPDNKDRKQKFACITHSTGGPVVRCWVDEFFGVDNLKDCPLTHLVMLAAPNHGSALAQIGKRTLGRMKAFFNGVEPGTKILDWLELSSQYQRVLNGNFCTYPEASASRPMFFNLTGQKIDKKFYDHLNSYTGEDGSDGVVRVASSNLNFRWLELHQKDEPIDETQIVGTRALVHGGCLYQSPRTVLEVIGQTSHSGDKYGIMKSVKTGQLNDQIKPQVQSIIGCLKVKSSKDYMKLLSESDKRSAEVQKRESKKNFPIRYSMIVFSVFDHEGIPLEDFDILLLGWRKAGSKGGVYDPDELPKGFFKDRQRNRKRRNSLTYYVNYDALDKGVFESSGLRRGRLGIRVIARPQEGLVKFEVGEWHSADLPLHSYLRPNETCYVDIYMNRRVDKEVFRFEDTAVIKVENILDLRKTVGGGKGTTID